MGLRTKKNRKTQESAASSEKSVVQKKSDAAIENSDKTSGITKNMQRSIAAAKAVESTWSADRAGMAEPVKGEDFIEDDIPVASIVLNKKNARTRYILPANPTKNALDPDHRYFKINQRLIDGIVEFAEHLKSEPIQSRIAVYQEAGRYITVFGHRRFLAWKVAFGDSVTIPCKVYHKEPKKQRLLKFIENSQKEDLPLDADLLDFIEALKDLEGQGLTTPEIYTALGISKTIYYQNTQIVKSKVVFQGILDFIITSKSVATELIKKVADEKMQIDVIALLAKGKSLDEAINAVKVQAAQKPKPKRAGRTRSSISIPALKGKHASKAARAIIEGGLKDLDWKGVDWDNLDSVQSRLALNIDILMSKLK